MQLWREKSQQCWGYFYLCPSFTKCLAGTSNALAILSEGDFHTFFYRVYPVTLYKKLLTLLDFIFIFLNWKSDSVFRAVLGWALFPFMHKQYLLHLRQPSNSHYDLLRHAQVHCTISFSTFVLVHK